MACASSSSDDASRCLLLALSNDALGVIVDGLADPLQPVVAVALSSTCLGLRTPLGAALEVLRERHEKAVALCRRVGTSCAELSSAEILHGGGRLVADDMATLGMILQTNGLPRLRDLYLGGNDFGDAGVQALCGGLGRGAAPSLRTLGLAQNNFGPAGAETLAAALGRGAMPKLEIMGLEALAAALGRGAMPKFGALNISGNPISNRGVAALAAPLRKLPALNQLFLIRCGIGDEGVASLVDNLGKDDFKELESLNLSNNKITDAGVAKLLAALDAGGLPKLVNDSNMLFNNPASAVAVEAIKAALAKRSH